MTSSPVRYACWSALCVIAVAALILGSKGMSLYFLAQDLDAKTAAIAAFYERSIAESAPSLRALPSVHTNEKAALDFLIAAPLRDGTIESIVTAQRTFIVATNLLEDADAKDHFPQLAALKRDLAKGGTVQAMLDGYNTRAQKWNNQRDDALGHFFVNMFDLQPRLLLQTDGKGEYETKVTI